LFPPLPVNFTGAGVGVLTGVVAVVVEGVVVVVVVVGGWTGAVAVMGAGLTGFAAEDSPVSAERINRACRNFMVFTQLYVCVDFICKAVCSSVPVFACKKERKCFAGIVIARVMTSF
jgi:hypothetical protein